MTGLNTLSSMLNIQAFDKLPLTLLFPTDNATSHLLLGLCESSFLLLKYSVKYLIKCLTDTRSSSSK